MLLEAILSLATLANIDDDVAQDDVTRAIPAYVLDERRLRTSFLDLYGRPPLADERKV